MTIEIDFWTEDEGLRELAHDYWALDADGEFAHSVASLAERQGVSPRRLPTILAEVCAAFDPAKLCRSCGYPRFFTNRTEYQRIKVQDAAWTCNDCIDHAREAARAAKEAEEQTRVASLAADLSAARTRCPEVEHLGFSQAVTLLAVVLAGASDDLSYVLPIDHFTRQLTPSREMDDQLVTAIYQDGILAIHPGSRATSLIMESGEYVRFKRREVHWALAFPDGELTTGRYLELAEKRLGEPWSATWEAEAGALHRELAVIECSAYLVAQMEAHNFAYAPNEKATVAIRTALRSFTMGQVLNFAYRAARDAASFFLRKATSAQHAMNIIPGAISRFAAQATVAGQTVKSFGRDNRSVPESALSHVLFTKALRLPAGGFDAIPPSD